MALQTPTSSIAEPAAVHEYEAPQGYDQVPCSRIRTTQWELTRTIRTAPTVSWPKSSAPSDDERTEVVDDNVWREEGGAESTTRYTWKLQTTAGITLP